MKTHQLKKLFSDYKEAWEEKHNSYNKRSLQLMNQQPKIPVSELKWRLALQKPECYHKINKTYLI